MPIQFEKYRFTKKTPLSDEVFNRIFRDIDLRLAALEDVKKDWQGAVNELIRLGLSRIETALRPAYEQVEQVRSQAQNALNEIFYPSPAGRPADKPKKGRCHKRGK